jgi:hypothetical protein
MVDAGSIRERMEVIGSDGSLVGRVEHVLGKDIELSRLDLAAGFKDHKIPMSWVDKIQDGKVCLTLTKDEAKARKSEKH